MKESHNSRSKRGFESTCTAVQEECSNKRLDLLVNVCLKEAWVRITHSRRVRNICSGEHLVFAFPLEGHYNAYIK